MSAAEAYALHSAAERDVRPRDRYRATEWARRFAPEQGWDTYLLLVAAVGVVALTVQDARWVATPGLPLIVVVATFTGLALARVRAAWPVLHLAALALGALVVVWQGSTLADGGSLLDRVGELLDRVRLFYEAATGGGISTDLLPVSLVILSAAWIMGYFSSWYLFRRTNVWVGLVVWGMAMLTALSFLPSRYVVSFFAFTFLAMMLVARVTMLQRRDRWNESGFDTFSPSRWLVVRGTVVFAAIVLLAATVLPLKLYHSTVAVNLWKLGRTPVAFLQDDMTRLLSALPSREERMGRFFGESLPFIGKIGFDNDVAFWADSEVPNYWLSRTYSRYTSQGWFTGDTEERPVGPDDPPPVQAGLKRELVSQSLQFSFETSKLLPGGDLNWVSRQGTAEMLSPMRFQIVVGEPNRDAGFPEEVRGIAAEIRARFSLPVAGFVESRISTLLPPDLVLDGVQYASDGGSTYLKRVYLTRQPPAEPDIVAWTLEESVEPEDGYQMNSFVSRATKDDLRAAGTNYGGFIRDHYLQLPESLPQRVRDLAAEVTRDAETPLDKAFAVRDYLRGDAFTYSRDIEKPPRGADGVDHFLFEAREGYGDYFSSAMTVMLRAVGVPARLAAGYAAGEVPEGGGRRAVRDSDSHGWTQVYFPEYGWIDFEPTPHWPEAAQFTSTSAPDGDAGTDVRRQAPYDCPIPDDVIGDTEFVRLYGPAVPVAQPASFGQETDPCEEIEPTAPSQQTPSSEDGSFALDPRVIDVGVPVAAGLAAVVLTALAAWLAWSWGLGRGPGERAYTKMSRLGTLAGIRRAASQTPAEYAEALGRASPRIAAGAHAVASAFAIGRYGGARPGDTTAADDAWKSVRGSLVLRALRRLVFAAG